jgi:hypothetical protein
MAPWSHIHKPYFLLKCFTLGLAPGLTHNYYPKLDKLAMEKHSSLLRKSVNYGLKKFYKNGPLESYSQHIFF